MSLVIAIRDKDRIVLGADKQVSTGGSKEHTSTKIWPVAELPGAIMGGVGSARASQIIQYANIIDKNLIDKSIWKHCANIIIFNFNVDAVSF